MVLPVGMAHGVADHDNAPRHGCVWPGLPLPPPLRRAQSHPAFSSCQFMPNRGVRPLHVLHTSFLSSPVVQVKTLGIFNGLRAIIKAPWVSDNTPWATRNMTWATEKTTWATVFSVAQVVFWPFGHEKRAPMGALCTLQSKDTTFSCEMQIALFRPLPRK